MLTTESSNKVCMLLLNNFTNDSRVQKEALSLLSCGYDVKVYAKLDSTVKEFEVRDGIEIMRIPVWRTKKKIKIATPFISKKNNFTGFFAQSNNLEGEGDSKKPKERFKYVEIVSNRLSQGLKDVKKYKSKLSPLRIARKIPFFSRPAAIISFNISLVSAVGNDNYQVVHAHDLNTLIAGYVIAKKNNAKLVYDSHELYLERNRFEKYSLIGKQIRKLLEKQLIKRCDLVITVNDSIASILRDSYSIDTPTVVMNTPNYKSWEELIDRRFSIRDELAIDPSLKIILYVGAITFNRGLENVLKAMALLPDCFLVMMGHGNDEYKNALQDIAVQLDVANRFEFFGPVPSDQVTMYASSADLGVAPIENVCQSYYLCSPNKLFEYLLSGLPVITSDFPELRQVVNKYDAGGVFDPSSPEDIARAASEVFAKNRGKDSMAKNASLVAEEYNWDNEARKMLAAYSAMV